MTRAADLLSVLVEEGQTIATAESLTGGGLGQLLTSVPGSSAAYVGGVVAYATRLKRELLEVGADVLDGPGAVSAECASAMASGVRRLLGADVGLATTGVAGPESQEGKSVGLVYVAVATGAGAVHRELRLQGDRDEVRAQAAGAAVDLAVEVLRRRPGR